MNWARYLAAIARYKWLVLVVTVLGTTAGVGITRWLPARYLTQSKLWIEVPRQGGQQVDGPIRSGELLQSYAWVDLLKSGAVLDQVVREQRLYLWARPRDAYPAIATFQVRKEYRPGDYTLKIDQTGRRYTLLSEGIVVERGALGDSIGSRVGFQWAPAPETLRPGRTIKLRVASIRDASLQLASELQTRTDLHMNFLTIEFTGVDPRFIAETVNKITERYVAVAAELKRAKRNELSRILEEQLKLAAASLTAAERQLESFRVATITLPSDQGAPVSAGLQMTQDPVFSSFFNLRLEREQLQRDREVILRVLAEPRVEPLSTYTLETIPSVQRSPALQAALTELTQKQVELRILQQRYTEHHDAVRRLQSDIARLEKQTIPQLGSALAAELRARDAELEALLGSASSELQNIPPRVIEEARLQRHVQIAENLYILLQQRYEEARLSAVSSIPDIRVLDAAAVPQAPVDDKARKRIMLMAFAGSLGLALVGAVFLDRIDPRVRYPEQVTGDMRLPILGAIPELRPAAERGDGSLQAIEAFREIRLNVIHRHGTAGPLLLAVSSPDTGDGKSFVVANLAASFAQQGLRTLVIDGDMRRGGLHHILKGTRVPGLTDLLSGGSSLAEVLQVTSLESVSLIGSGTRMPMAPELLGSSSMRRVLQELRAKFDVIVIDSPPLAAGVDPFVLGTVCGNLVLVVRTGNTHRAAAASRLSLLERLPVRILGAVLNCIPAGQRAYRYYAYLPGYHAEEETTLAEEERSPTLTS